MKLWISANKPEEDGYVWCDNVEDAVEEIEMLRIHNCVEMEEDFLEEIAISPDTGMIGIQFLEWLLKDVQKNGTECTFTIRLLNFDNFSEIPQNMIELIQQIGCPFIDDSVSASNSAQPSFDRILATEYSNKFDKIRKDMMIMSFYKYGPLKDNYGKFKCLNAIANLKIRLDKYITTGNTEYLCDVANYAMLEFMHPSIEGAKYTPTDDPQCEVAGFGINEIRNFDKE